MNSIIIISTAALALVGLAVSIWSIASTRRKYYNEYLSIKGVEND